jgi:hypothetical protein
MSYKTTLVAAAICLLAGGFAYVDQAQAGTCQTVKAKGVAKTLTTATLYAQADLKQTAMSMKGKVTQATTNCERAGSDFKCKINAVVCPK